ncbi:two-component system sensor histidine kinase/response regulator [Saccharobesus litoralis]|uniref:histidine kinase n=1 Tax=Saccharobesus litoralis TaxID=2172099 RepID=A0A2S0VLD8_9ALTE|nr:response regulator [Saccharobesus litoralis]AWB65034.1 two-component system sensor histidine kinase/response regulator [Saccharobesus litoralis]
MFYIKRLAKVKNTLFSSVVLIVVIGFGAINYYGINNAATTTRWVEHTYQVINDASHIELLLSEMESSQRNFLLTGNETHLQPFITQEKALLSAITDLQQLVSDNPPQVEKLEQFKALLQQWLTTQAKPLIAERQKVAQGAGSLEDLQSLVGSEKGKNIFDNIRVELAAMDQAFYHAENAEARVLVLAIAKSLVDMETGERGYLITGNDKFLQPYRLGQSQITEQIDQLHQLLNNSFNPQYVKAQLDDLAFILSQWRNHLITGLVENKQNSQPIKRSSDLVLSAKTTELATQVDMRLTSLYSQFSQAHNQKAVNLLLSIRELMAQQQVLAKGYVLTNHQPFIEKLTAEHDLLQVKLTELEQMLAVSFSANEMRRHLNKVEFLSKEWRESAAMPLIELRTQINQAPNSITNLVAEVEQQSKQSQITELRELLNIFKQVELDLLIKRQADAKSTATFMLWLVVLGTLAIASFAVVVLRASSALRVKSDELQQERSKLEQQNWVKSSFSDTVAQLQGHKQIEQFGNTLLTTLVPKLNGQLGLFYFTQKSDDGSPYLSLLSSFAFSQRKNLASSYQFGESLVGQCALEQKTILLSNAPNDYIVVSSGAGDAAPQNIIIFPILFEKNVLAVVEIASLQAFSSLHQLLIEQLVSNTGVILNNILAQHRTQELLTESQAQSEELQAQQEELRVANSNLEAQTNRLTESEQNLQQQSEELRVANEELEEKQELQKKQHAELEKAKQEVDRKAQDLATASQYKTEFLANMSHELRTPLNSLLILSKELSKNRHGNLTKEQLEDIDVIHSGGHSLLTLINDIMDLSKVEAGKLHIESNPTSIKSTFQSLQRLFAGAASDKGLKFIIDIDTAIPDYLLTDALRLEQIIKNFLSNAFKFTSAGEVKLQACLAEQNKQFKQRALQENSVLAITVSDTGIGIAPEKQQQIFEAFQQADGSTTRKFGGTGLGLTISKQLAELLGGEIQLTSQEGAGSQVTLYLPLIEASGQSDNRLINSPSNKALVNSGSEPEAKPDSQSTTTDPEIAHRQASARTDESGLVLQTEPFIDDDRRIIQQGERCILIIEDDLHFAQVLQKLAHEDDYKCLITDKGREGIYLAKEYKPTGILLDMGLPDIDGAHVLEQLKFNLITRHIPVHVISGGNQKVQSLNLGAYSFIEKPAESDNIRTVLAQIEKSSQGGAKQVLVIEDDSKTQQAVKRLLDVPDIELTFAANSQQVNDCLNKNEYDCIVLDLGLPDISGIEVLEKINQLPGNKPPVIIYTGQEISDQDMMILGKNTADIIIKGVESPERLLDDVTLFLHSVGHDLPEEQKSAIELLHNEHDVLRGKKILLVDDDMRNVFAMSRQLTAVGLDVVMAENGKKAIDLLEQGVDEETQFDLILMDIMMPVMDGYEAMTRIRKMPLFKEIPIIALTAKAMTEDKHKCFDAGASEYITKPVDMDKLISILSVWLYENRTKHG